jgi:hypothetical protein
MWLSLAEFISRMSLSGYTAAEWNCRANYALIATRRSCDRSRRQKKTSTLVASVHFVSRIEREPRVIIAVGSEIFSADFARQEKAQIHRKVFAAIRHWRVSADEISFLSPDLGTSRSVNRKLFTAFACHTSWLTSAFGEMNLWG